MVAVQVHFERDLAAAESDIRASRPAVFPATPSSLGAESADFSLNNGTPLFGS